MTNTHYTHIPTISKSPEDQCPTGGTTLRRVGQDKNAIQCERIATKQPVTPQKTPRTRGLNKKTSCIQKNPRQKRQTEYVMLWVKPTVKAELERIAQAEGLSLSATGAAFLEKAIQQDIHTQHGALLETIITQAIGKSMRAYSNRIALLLIRVAYDAGQTRAIVTNILKRQPGVTPQLLTTILDGSSNTAKRNITTRTPQLAEIIKELETLLTEQEQGK